MTLQPYVKERILAFLIILALYLLSVALGIYTLPAYEHASGIRDIGHLFVPSLLSMYGRETTQYIWWLGTLPEELLYGVIVLVILFTGKGIRLGFCLYGVYFLHWLFLHATTLPVPDDMVGLFPEGVFTLAKLDRPDFWFSGHVANGFLIALATAKSPHG